MADSMIGRMIIITPLRGEADIEQDIEGRIIGRVQRGESGIQEYFLVKLSSSIHYRHPSLGRIRLSHVLVTPDGTLLEWAFFGGGPPELPVLVKVFGVLPGSGKTVVDYAAGETFLIARGIAASGDRSDFSE